MKQDAIERVEKGRGSRKRPRTTTSDWAILGFLLTLIISTLLPATVAGARGLPLFDPDPERGSIALTLRGRPALGPTISAVQVYFVHLDETPDLLETEALIPSNYSGKKQVYLLNCKPGRYAVVAAKLSSRGTGMTFKAALDAETISASEVLVEPGKMAFAGVLMLALRTKISDASPLQAHLLGILDPEMADRAYLTRAFAGSALYLGDLRDADRSVSARRAFATKAIRKVFRDDPQWHDLVKSILTPSP